MKMLVVLWWAPKDVKEVTTRFTKWKGTGKYDVLYPYSTMIGLNKVFMVVEADDLAELQQDITYWSDKCTFKLIPIMDTRDAVAVTRE